MTVSGFSYRLCKTVCIKAWIEKPSPAEALHTSVQYSPLLDGVRSGGGPACSATAQHHLKAVLTWERA